MSINFGIPTDLTIQGNLTVAALNGILKGSAGLVSVATAGTDYVTPATLTSTGVQLGVSIASLSGLIVTNLATSGGNLYVLMTGMSGQANVNYATVVNLASTGQQAWTATQNNALNLSGNLTATGTTLRFLTLGGDTNLSGVIATTGSNLYMTMTGLSGQFNTAFATTANLATTGTTLYNDIIGFSGLAAQTGNVRGYTGFVGIGLDSLAVTFTPAFPGVPAVVPALQSTGSLGYFAYPSGVSANGYTAIFSATTTENLTLHTDAIYRA